MAKCNFGPSKASTMASSPETLCWTSLYCVIKGEFKFGSVGADTDERKRQARGPWERGALAQTGAINWLCVRGNKMRRCMSIEGATKIKKGKLAAGVGAARRIKGYGPPKLNRKWDVTSNHEFIARAPSEEEPRGTFLPSPIQTLFPLDPDRDLVQMQSSKHPHAVA